MNTESPFHEATIRNMTIDERVHYQIPVKPNDVEEELLKQVGKRLEKHYERMMEQSEFRAQLLEEIQRLCNHAPTRYKETKTLVAQITAVIENSYVEL